VGGNAQTKPMRRVAGRLKLELSQYRDLEAFAQFGSDLDSETRQSLARGERLVSTLNQSERNPIAVEDQVIQIFAATNGFLDRILVEKVGRFLTGAVDAVHSANASLVSSLADGKWDDEQTPKDLTEVLKTYAEDFGYDLDEEGLPLEDEA
jgi:F-type H+/Na+-transporting ATPase subunit alpha